MITHPCGICDKSVIMCDVSKFWIHIKCNGPNAKDYITLENLKKPWFCSKCIDQTLPFGDKLSPLCIHLTPPLR